MLKNTKTLVISALKGKLRKYLLELKLSFTKSPDGCLLELKLSFTKSPWADFAALLLHCMPFPWSHYGVFSQYLSRRKLDLNSSVFTHIFCNCRSGFATGTFRVDMAFLIFPQKWTSLLIVSTSVEKILSTFHLFV